MTTSLIAVSATTESHLVTANLAAQTLGLPFLPDPAHEQAEQYAFILFFTPDFVGLKRRGEKKIFHIDFGGATLSYRTQQASFKNELLARAMGVKPKDHPVLVDATAGWGRDSFLLATLGYDVIMLERSPILCLLLKDAFARAELNANLAPVVSRLTLVQGEAESWLASHSAQVVYLDPMFPARQKSALVKKEMVILQALLPKADDERTLFHQAMACASLRVVVKRPRLAMNIAETAPNFSLTGKSSRFDIYLAKRK